MSFLLRKETEDSEVQEQSDMKTITMADIIGRLPLMCYFVQIISHETHPGQVVFEVQVSCPDGRILQTQQMEDLLPFLQDSFFRKDEFIIDQLAFNITASLLDGLRKDIQDKVSQTIFKVMTE